MNKEVDTSEFKSFLRVFREMRAINADIIQGWIPMGAGASTTAATATPALCFISAVSGTRTSQRLPIYEGLPEK